MAIENLIQNIEMEKVLVKEIINFSSQLGLENALYYKLGEPERKLLRSALNSSIERLRMLNNSVPKILEAISPFKTLETLQIQKQEQAPELVQISYIPEERAKKISVAIEKKDKEKFLRGLSLSKETLKRLRGTGLGKNKEVGFMEFKPTHWYIKMANKLFFNLSNYYMSQGKLKRVNSDLRKANMSFLVTSYISMILMSTLIALIIGIAVSSILLAMTKSYTLNNILIGLSPLLLPFITFIVFYSYPSLEKGGIQKSIDEEIPFVTIHMSAIARSGIEPTQIFKIIALGEEYPHTKKEFRKIINQVNIYGYDVITALKNTAMETSSKKLNELLNGMASTISGGGEMSDFLDKRAETLMFDYRLEQEKKGKSAETFMDLYLSMVVAAPMILTFLMLLIAISGIDMGLSLFQLNIVILSVIALINIVFLIFLEIGK